MSSPAEQTHSSSQPGRQTLNSSSALTPPLLSQCDIHIRRPSADGLLDLEAKQEHPLREQQDPHLQRSKRQEPPEQPQQPPSPRQAATLLQLQHQNQQNTNGSSLTADACPAALPASGNSHAPPRVDEPNLGASAPRSIVAAPGPSPHSHASLRLHTDIPARSASLDPRSYSGASTPGSSSSRKPTSILGLPARTPSLRARPSSATTIGSLSPSSTLSSPALGPMADLTPLPSPIVADGSPGPWGRKPALPETGQAEQSTGADQAAGASAAVPGNAESRSTERRKAYHGLTPAANENVQGSRSSAHNRNRSVSEFAANAVQHITPRPRIPTISGPDAPPNNLSAVTDPSCLRREEHLATSRGIAPPSGLGIPTPPQSDRGKDGSDSDAPIAVPDAQSMLPRLKTSPFEYFYATRLSDNTIQHWRALRILGQGTFSKVVLAISDHAVPSYQNGVHGDEANGTSSEVAQDDVPNTAQLVAVKIVEQGPAGGASEERISSSLKRELDILKSIRHPSLVHLQAFSIEPSRALLVLSYCPGGDLFDFASQRRTLLSPALIRRIFAELVAATLYLHEQHIVHRDIKLENVLLHLTADQVRRVDDWLHYPFAVVCLTDLGLSRRIDPADARLQTRCGSEDYAAPELLMGQPYDGRQTDAWALGVLLYALMEGRLPFDALPGAAEYQRQRSRTVHRIARCDWSWFKYTDPDGEPAGFGPELEGARAVVEALLKRATRRTPLEQVAQSEWVRGGIQVDGGLRFRAEDL